MLAAKFEITIPSDHHLDLMLPRELPAGPAEVIILSRPRRSRPSEAELLREINQGLASAEWERYHELLARRRAETLTAQEQDELIAMCDRLEEDNVRRIECLGELARRRGVTLDTLMDDLGIRPAPIDG